MIKQFFIWKIVAFAYYGDAQQQYNLAIMYQDGRDIIPQNPIKAFYWFRKSAKQGHADAQYELGMMYYTGGDSVKQDSIKAVHWLKLSAEQGNAKATAQLEKLGIK